MQGKKQHQEKLFNSFQLSEYVPAENFYRQLKSVLDLQFMYKATRSYYGSEGQQSIDPTVFFKLILVGYLENLNSDRKIIAHAKMRLDIYRLRFRWRVALVQHPLAYTPIIWWTSFFAIA